jgi:hypothetical protein
VQHAITDPTKSSSTMQISYEHALEGFSRFDRRCQLPTISPTYVAVDAERNQELEPLFWLYEEDENCLYQGGHLASIPGTQYRDLQTPYQYGGPVCNTRDSAFLFRAWKAYTTWCRDHAIAVEFVRFHPLLRNWDLYPDEGTFNRETVWMDLARADLMASYQTRVRTAVRKAVKNGLSVEWRTGSGNAEWFMEFYNSTMREIGAELFYFFPLSYFRRLLAWDQARLAVCMCQDEPVAAAIFLIGPDMAEYHLSAANQTGKHLGGTTLLLHEAAQTAKLAGCSAMYLGGGTDNRPDNPLLFFKAGFSTERAAFKIGKYVHSEEAYSSLKLQFAQAHEASPGRVLFYR